MLKLQLGQTYTHLRTDVYPLQSSKKTGVLLKINGHNRNTVNTVESISSIHYKQNLIAQPETGTKRILMFC